MNGDATTTVPATLEVTEPKAEQAAAPVWLFVLLLLLLFFGFVYFDKQSAWCNPQVYAPYYSIEELTRYQPSEGPEQAFLALGKANYDKVCALCHDPSGAGHPNQAPPFIGSEWVLGSPTRLIRIPLYGLQNPITVKGQQYTFASSMPAMGATMTDQELAAVLSYMRNSWGNKAEFVKPEQVKAVRTEVATRTQPFTPEELQKVQ